MGERRQSSGKRDDRAGQYQPLLAKSELIHTQSPRRRRHQTSKAPRLISLAQLRSLSIVLKPDALPNQENCYTKVKPESLKCTSFEDCGVGLNCLERC